MNVNVATKIVKQVKELTRQYCVITQTVEGYSIGSIKVELNLYISDISIDNNPKYDNYTRKYAKNLKELDLFLVTNLTRYKTVFKK